MSVCTLGVSHKTAPVHIREQLAFTSDAMRRVLKDLKAARLAPEIALISTCNRTELYCTGTDVQVVSAWWRDYQKVDEGIFHRHMYTHQGEQAVQHIMRVASGLDSLVLGEPEILGQMKTAFHLAEDIGSIGTKLTRLFQQTFSVAKQVRTETGVGTHSVSVACAAVNLAKHVFSDLSKACVLLVGAGSTIELTAQHLAHHQVKDMIVANRTFGRAQQLAGRYNARAVLLDDISSYLAKADIVISSTGSEFPIISAKIIQDAMLLRRHRPMFMVDLAIPRDIECQAKDIDGVYLYTIDALESIVRENHELRKGAAIEAESLINLQATEYLEWLGAQGPLKLVGAYRDKMLCVKDKAIAEALAQLAAGKLPEQVIEHLAHQMTNKMLHQPTVRLREAIYAKDEDMIAAYRKLLDIE